MAKFPCPICGDPSGYLLWLDDQPPDRCPHDPAWQEEGAVPTVRNVSECAYQMGKARQRAAWQKAMPAAFDENGNMKPGGLVKCLEAHPPGEPVII